MLAISIGCGSSHAPGSTRDVVPLGGDGQTGTVGAVLATPFTVSVTDAGRPVAGVSVSFDVTSGSGTLSVTTGLTDEYGQAKTTLTLGRTAGTNTVEASVPGVAGSPVVFTAVGVAGAPAMVLAMAGTGQSAVVGSQLSSPFVATVEDMYSNPISGASVEFVVTGGGGTPSITSTITDTLGEAQTVLTLGATPGANTVEARVPGIPPAEFIATGLVGQPAQVIVTSGNNQNGAAGSTLVPFVVTVEDAEQNPIPGVTVAWAVTTGDGRVSPTSAVTDAQGEAQTTVMLGTSATTAVAARVSGLPDAVFTSSISVFPTGTHPTAVAIGDFNGDGLPDLATANQDSSNISVLLNTTATGMSPSFAPNVDFSTGQNPNLAIGDFNGDGKPDLAVTSPNENTVYILLNTTVSGATTPSFAAKVGFTVGSPGSVFIAVADVNADGRPDLVIASVDDPTVSVLLNTTATDAATPTFTPHADFSTGLPIGLLAIADLNGDGKPDIVTVGGAISVLPNTTVPGSATASFAAAAPFSGPSSAGGVAVGDLNGDGKPDLAISKFNSNTVAIFLDTAPTGALYPSFAAEADFPAGSTPVGIAIGDLDGDGVPDLAVTNETIPGSFAELINTTATGGMPPSFTTRLGSATMGSDPTWIAIGNLAGDGKPYLAFLGLPNTVEVVPAP